LVPDVPLDPDTLDWGAALRTELNWLMEQTIIIGLTETDIQQIELNAEVGYENSQAITLNLKDTWQTHYIEEIILVYGDGGIGNDELPKTVPIRTPIKRPVEELPYISIAVVITVIFLVILAVFSYTRLKRRSILDNLNRKNIFEYIKENPGVHFKKLLRELDFQPGAMSYHLNVLEKGEYIKSIQDGNLRRFYLYGTKSDFKIALTTIQLRILSIVDERPGISQVKISKTIGKNRMLVNYHIKILKEAGILSLEKSGRESLCFTTNIAASYLAG